MPLYCPNCGTANEEFAEYCASCGETLEKARIKKEKSEPQATQTESSVPKEDKKLYRSRTNKMMTGLSAGMADYFDMEVDLVRILWIIAFAVSGGAIFLVYLILALATPLEPETTAT